MLLMPLQTASTHATVWGALLFITGCSLFGLDGDGRLIDAMLPTSAGPVTLEEGDTVFLSDVHTRVTFVAKTEDSRCPLGVDCVWEGEVTIVLDVTRGSDDPVPVTLKGHVGPDGDGAVSAEAAGLRFTLKRVAPYPQYDVPPPESSTIQLLVEEV